jgi:SulP family sulfate permease
MDTGQALPPGVEVFEIHGPFCFGAVRKFTEVLSATRTLPPVVIVVMEHVLALDATGLHALETTASRLRQQKTTLLLVGVQAQPLQALSRSGTLDRLGRDCLLETLPDAIHRARTLVGGAAA